jgi:hypothetical protein
MFKPTKEEVIEFCGVWVWDHGQKKVTYDRLRLDYFNADNARGLLTSCGGRKLESIPQQEVDEIFKELEPIERYNCPYPLLAGIEQEKIIYNENNFQQFFDILTLANYSVNSYCSLDKLLKKE